MFSWIPIYKQLSDELLKYENNQPALVNLLEKIGITNLNDKDSSGATFKMNEIDPLTFLCYLNKYGDEKRLHFLQQLCLIWNIQPLPTDVNGIPNVNAQKVWLYGYQWDRKPTDIPLLWTFFKALMNNVVTNALFDEVLKIKNVGKQKITEAMFMVKPDDYLCLNGIVKPFLNQKGLSTDFGSFTDYVARIQAAKSQLQKSFPEISYEAWLKAISDPVTKIDARVEDPEPPYIHLKNSSKTEVLNLILYGPPGTGKTYHTIDKALQIVDAGFYEVNKDNREALTQRFRSLLIDDWGNANGQIAFVTFHQSMSYEDFVEGIKPDVNSGEKDISYVIEPGVFKRISQLADTRTRVQDNFDSVYLRLLQEIDENDGSLVLATTKKGKEFTIYENSKGNLRFHANTEKAYEGVMKKELISHYLKTGIIDDWPSYTRAVGEYLISRHGYTNAKQESVKNYVLIIDEINRGNVSQIFGELITLIEQDKRKGEDEELSVILPYSKKLFSVPDNLFIIGTMNTADRSVESLDTALRRRFSFQEQMPQPELLSPKQMLVSYLNRPENKTLADAEWFSEPHKTRVEAFYKLIGFSREQEKYILGLQTDHQRKEWLMEDIAALQDQDFTGINMQSLLEAINTRLEKLLSKDHQIGHAFFINVQSEADLYQTFYQKLIPQLQEYFYGDPGKMGLVIGSEFVTYQRAEKEVRFARFEYEDVEQLLERPIYRIHDFNVTSETDYEAFLNAVRLIYA